MGILWAHTGAIGCIGLVTLHDYVYVTSCMYVCVWTCAHCVDPLGFLLRHLLQLWISIAKQPNMTGYPTYIFVK